MMVFYRMTFGESGKQRTTPGNHRPCSCTFGFEFDPLSSLLRVARRDWRTRRVWQKSTKVMVQTSVLLRT
jgi:hypothetical protein